jgi:hypothetical protein
MSWDLLPTAQLIACSYLVKWKDVLTLEVNNVQT